MELFIPPSLSCYIADNKRIKDGTAINSIQSKAVVGPFLNFLFFRDEIEIECLPSMELLADSEIDGLD